MHMMEEYEIKEWLYKAMAWEVILPEQLDELKTMLSQEMIKAKYYSFSGWRVQNFKDIADEQGRNHDHLTDDEIREIMINNFEEHVDTYQQGDLLLEVVSDHCPENEED